MSHNLLITVSPRVSLRAILIAAVIFGSFACNLSVWSQEKTTSPSADSAMRVWIDLFEADHTALQRKFPLPQSPAFQPRFQQFYDEWQALLARLNFNELDFAGQVDYLLLANYIQHEESILQRNSKRLEELQPLLACTKPLLDLEEAHRQMLPVDSSASAKTLTQTKRAIENAQSVLQLAARKGEAPSALIGYRASKALRELQFRLREWHTFYGDYDPDFTWWNKKPYEELDKALTSYHQQIEELVVGAKSSDPTSLVGDSIGREALLAELAYEQIPYTPEELLTIAEREFAWCEAEMKKAATEMNCPDWATALEKVKAAHVAPGQQPQLIRQLALEATQFVEDRQLVTVPPLAKESWRMEMMTPQRQLVNPFFTGGEVISISFPTSGMTHEQKMMSLRGNNIHFARATVHHELIPGHHLQAFMNARHRPYRQIFRTPFWTEGWALYWEMYLWDLNFAKSPENRVGMLFWRSHRCARIIFSLKFHLGKMTPQECVDFLVTRVGHERDNATAEVRRSINGDYSPLYQAAYMLGGLQFRELHKELVHAPTNGQTKAPPGKFTPQQFHDAILHENCIPVDMVRLILTKPKLTRDYQSQWRFYPGLE
ncbi:MAG: DUF885 family protein [Planctomycetaceae bacterium]